ncbi:inactive protein RESTRICTED TEV MOVEMENT 2-like [Phoenix dactylifera]|uniref:Inactive protein RESTRICTED TEV MOVEMENT 2-like n=1 Tax=Phoenix dactylifera TaxID=42345 RepID=A0A8B7C1C8_PHODC|nr:inactive protein RESTRICTED TEV MOVEMENT 2-like [Phoenix dactylifera]
METKAAPDQPVYEDFVPSYKLVQDEGLDTIVIELTEFKKEQVRVQFENFRRLSISGERPLADNRWSRFRNVFEAPKECDEIRAKFENGRLYLKVLPKIAGTSMEAAIIIRETREKVQPTQATKQDEKRGEPHKRKDEEKVGEKEKDQTKEKKDKEKVEPGLGFSKPVQVLANVIVAVVLLVVMALYVTSKK